MKKKGRYLELHEGEEKGEGWADDRRGWPWKSCWGNIVEVEGRSMFVAEEQGEGLPRSKKKWEKLVEKNWRSKSHRGRGGGK